MTPKPIDDAARAEQRQWFEQFNPQRDADAEQAAYLRQWARENPDALRRRPVEWRWLGLGLAVLLIVAVWLTWAWATGPVG